MSDNDTVRDQGYNCEDLLDKAYDRIELLNENCNKYKEVISTLTGILEGDGYSSEMIAVWAGEDKS